MACGSKEAANDSADAGRYAGGGLCFVFGLRQ